MSTLCNRPYYLVHWSSESDRVLIEGTKLMRTVKVWGTWSPIAVDAYTWEGRTVGKDGRKCIRKCGGVAIMRYTVSTLHRLVHTTYVPIDRGRRSKHSHIGPSAARLPVRWGGASLSDVQWSIADGVRVIASRPWTTTITPAICATQGHNAASASAKTLSSTMSWRRRHNYIAVA